MPTNVSEDRMDVVGYEKDRNDKSLLVDKGNIDGKINFKECIKIVKLTHDQSLSDTVSEFRLTVPGFPLSTSGFAN